MNRQLGPSIILSVLIVAFFSVVLYQPDSRGGSGTAARPNSSSLRDSKKEPARAPAESRLVGSVFSGTSNRLQSGANFTRRADAAETSTFTPFRRIRTTPKEIGSTPGASREFSVSASDERDPIVVTPGRWRKVR